MGALILLGLSLFPVAQASESPHLFVRNRAVIGRAAGGEVYVPIRDLTTYFTADEVARVHYFESSQQVQIGDQSFLAAEGLVPVSQVAQALGLSRRVSNGIVDYAKLPGDTPAKAPPDSIGSRRGEYAEAGKRLDGVLQMLPPAHEEQWAKRIESIGKKVANASPLAGMEWKFVLVRAKEPNAACVGEGHVFVTTALMQMGVSDDELAGVLGHEVAHGVRRHPFKRVDLIRDLTVLLRDYERLRGQLANLGGQPSSMAVTVRNEVSNYERRRATLQDQLDHLVFYSRVDEEEADVLGLRYAVTAGYSPEGLGSCLVRLTQQAVEQFGVAVLQDDMSHPPVARRLEILRRARDNGHF